MFELFNPQIDVGILILRVALGVLMILHGIPKLKGHEGTANYFKSIGIPLPGLNAWISFLVETIGGVMILLGLLTPIFAFLVFGNMAVATWASIFKDKLPTILTDGKPGWEMPFLYLLGFLLIFLIGPGIYSLDFIIFA